MQFKKNLFLKFIWTVLVALGFAGCAATISTKEAISTKAAPTVLGPYSQAISFGNLVFLSGQIPIDPKTNQMQIGSIEDQTKLVLENLKAILAAKGMTMDNIVSTTVYLKDLNHFARMNAVYGTYFTKEIAPARATVQVADLPRDALIEISAIAGK